MNVNSLCGSSERSPFAMECVTLFCEYLSLLATTVVVKAQQQIEIVIQAFADNPPLEASIKTKDASVAAAQENLKQKTDDNELELAKLRRQVSDKSENLPEIEELSFYYFRFILEDRFVSEGNSGFDDKVSNRRKKLEKSTSAAAYDEQVACLLQIKLQASENNAKELLATLQDSKTAWADQVAMVTEITALAGSARLQIRDEMTSLHSKFDSYRLE